MACLGLIIVLLLTLTASQITLAQPLLGGSGYGSGSCLSPNAFLSSLTNVPAAPIAIVPETDFIPVSNIFPVVNVFPTVQ
ncbi:hypothetical protein B0O80DRAFT_468898 [Mortierella sp. GBAus27b]|nr:hypothetical protein B0O80DRAFT_468898 [Mortierella sp. GBAus27b]